MGKRGKVSRSAGLIALPAERGARPAPPAILNESEAAAWQEWVGCMPADYFRPEDLPQLVELVGVQYDIQTIKVQLRQIGSGDLLGGIDLKAHNALRKELREHLRIFVLLLRGLRLTKQSLDRRTATRKRLRDGGVASEVRMPWQYTGDVD